MFLVQKRPRSWHSGAIACDTSKNEETDDVAQDMRLFLRILGCLLIIFLLLCSFNKILMTTLLIYMNDNHFEIERVVDISE